MKLNLSKLFQYVVAISSKHCIDESHSLGHSMRVFHFAEQIAKEEPVYIAKPAVFDDQHEIIRASTILHDTCDKKYRCEKTGLVEIGEFLTPMMSVEQVTATLRIIEHMSYSKVTKFGMPDLGEYQTAFNVVREADLMDAYDFDRSMIYHMNRYNKPIENAYVDACELFNNRVFRHDDDGLLLTKYAKNRHKELSQIALLRIEHWKNILSIEPEVGKR